MVKIVLIAGVIAGGPAAALAQVSGGNNDLTSLATGSVVTVLATLVIGFIRGWVVPGTKYDALELKYDAILTELKERNRDDRDVLIPTLVKNTEVITRLHIQDKEQR